VKPFRSEMSSIRCAQFLYTSSARAVLTPNEPGRTGCPNEVRTSLRPVEVAMPYRIAFFAAVGVLVVSAHEIAHRLNVSARLRVLKPTIQISQSLQTEHEPIYRALLDDTKALGRSARLQTRLAGCSGRTSSKDETALPPLGLLAPLAAGQTSADWRQPRHDRRPPCQFSRDSRPVVCTIGASG
jgi:hypothetical protein